MSRSDEQRRARCRPPAARVDAIVFPPVIRSTIHRTSTSFGRRLTHDHAVTKHRHAVSDPQQFFQPVRDVDDRHAVRREVADGSGTARGISAAEQRRRRLVHHQHAHVAHERTGDLDDLLLSERQRPSGCCGISLPELLEDLTRRARPRSDGRVSPIACSARGRRTGSRRPSGPETAAVPDE